METEYFVCDECSGGCGLVVEFPKTLLEICDGGVRIMYCDVEGCSNRSDYKVHMSPFPKPKHICEEHWIAMMKDAKQLEFRR